MGGLRATAVAGLPADPDSSCRSGCSRATSVEFFSRRWRTPSSPDNCTSPAGYNLSATHGTSPSTSGRARETEWVVYAKRPFAGPEQVLDYLGRYTHRIAISNQRLCSLHDDSVRFRYTDYRRAGASRKKTMTLTATEFIRRMLLHVLPPGFHRIRHYGFLANRNRQQKLTECRRLLRTPPPAAETGPVATDHRDRYEALTGRSGGGLASDGSSWVACRPGFFLPVRVLSRYFRRVLLAALENAFESGQLHFAGRLQSLSDPRHFAEHLRPARETEWVVYAKRPFAGPEQVLDYLGRYTHRIAISNQRLCSLHDDSVRFRYTDYRRAGASRKKTMTLTATEFIRRMLLHVLPPGFHRIRHYGFLANRNRQQKLTECRRLYARHHRQRRPARSPLTIGIAMRR